MRRNALLNLILFSPLVVSRSINELHSDGVSSHLIPTEVDNLLQNKADYKKDEGSKHTFVKHANTKGNGKHKENGIQFNSNIKRLIHQLKQAKTNYIHTLTPSKVQRILHQGFIFKVPGLSQHQVSSVITYFIEHYHKINMRNLDTWLAKVYSMHQPLFHNIFIIYIEVFNIITDNVKYDDIVKFIKDNWIYWQYSKVLLAHFNEIFLNHFGAQLINTFKMVYHKYPEEYIKYMDIMETLQKDLNLIPDIVFNGIFYNWDVENDKLSIKEDSIKS